MWVMLLYMGEDVYLNQGLLCKLLLVFDDLQRSLLLFLVIVDFEHLSVGSFAQKFKNLVPIGDVATDTIHVLLSVLKP